MGRGHWVLPRRASRWRWGRIGQAEQPINKPPVHAGGFFCAWLGIQFRREIHATCAFFSGHFPWPRVLRIKKTAFSAVGKLGITGANTFINVVLRVATTLFGETTGSEALIPVVRHKPPSVGGLALLPVSFFAFRTLLETAI